LIHLEIRSWDTVIPIEEREVEMSLQGARGVCEGEAACKSVASSGVENATNPDPLLTPLGSLGCENF